MMGQQKRRKRGTNATEKEERRSVRKVKGNS